MNPGALAIVPVREGILPLGGEETIAECEGTALLIGTGVATAAKELGSTPPGRLLGWEAGDFRPAAWAEALFDTVSPFATVVLPASPDGRDLAPHLAAVLRRPLLSAATRLTFTERTTRVEVVRRGGLVGELYESIVPLVVTMQPGVRGIEVPLTQGSAAAVEMLDLGRSNGTAGSIGGPDNPELIEMLPPDPATMDLSEAPRIVAGGQGLGSAEAFARLGRIAAALGASLGATRVAADAGWVPFERQIGTTGVAVNPRLYIALAISGAVQHTSGLGHPDHIISVNLDPSCPMSTMADLAIVCDARALIDELAGKLLASTDMET